MRRLVDALGAVTIVFVGYLLLGEELHSWRGALIGLLLIWGSIELIVAFVSLARDGWTLRSAAHGLGAFLAAVVGLTLAGTWRWVVFAAFVLTLAVLRKRLLASDRESDEQSLR